MFDILSSTVDEPSVGGSLELERFKVKLREIWEHMLTETFAAYDQEMDEVQYREANALKFSDELEEESEIDNLMAMLDDMINPQEEREEVSSGGAAPKYSGVHLKSVKEGRKSPSTSYSPKHAMSKKPNDSRSLVKSSTYKVHTGKIAPRKDDKVIRSFKPIAEVMRDELATLRAWHRRNDP
jgi:hypothetical protein